MPYTKKCIKPLPDVKCSLKLRRATDCVLNFINLPGSLDRSKKMWICSSCFIKITVQQQKSQSASTGTPAYEQLSRTESSIDETSPAPGPSKVQRLNPMSTSVTSKSASTNDVESQSESDGEENVIKTQLILQAVNNALPAFGISPIYASKLDNRKQHQQQKLIKLTANISSPSMSSLGIEPLLNQTLETEDKARLFDEFMDQLKTKFQELEKPADKIQLLTVLPESLTMRYIQDQFKTTLHMVQRAKELLHNNGPLSRPEPKIGRKMSDELKKAVVDYYCNDDVSRVLPGINDCVTVNREKVQKRLMMCTLRECHAGYNEHHAGDESKKISFSQFALLRPKNCVQPGSSGTHAVCVCTIHQNVKLIIHGANISSKFLNVNFTFINLNLIFIFLFVVYFITYINRNYTW